MAPNLRPEAGLLAIRKGLNLFANLRPAYLYNELADACPLKKENIGDGFDMIIVRELTGGLYFGERHTEEVDGVLQATDTLTYNENEIRRIAIKAFDIAMKRRKHVISVDKANVLDSSRLWRKVVEEVAKDYPEVKLEHMLVDNCAMQLVMNPGIPLFIQFYIVFNITTKFLANMNNRNKRNMNDEELAVFFETARECFKFANDGFVLNKDKYVSLGYSEEAAEMFYMIKHNCVFKDMPFEYSEGKKEVYLNCNNVYISKLTDQRVGMHVMDYRDGKLVIDGSFRQVFDLEDFELYVQFGDKRQVLTNTDRYSLTKYFGISAYKKFTFHLELELDPEKPQQTVAFFARYKDSIIPLKLSFLHHWSKFTIKPKNSYWRFNKYVAYIDNSSTIVICHASAMDTFKRELKFLPYVFKESKRSFITRIQYWLTRPFFKNKKIWLMYDKLYKGGDSCEYLYRYCADKKDGISRYYIIDKNTSDYKRLKADGLKPVKNRSFKHKMLFLNTDIALITNSNVFPFNGYSMDRSRFIRGLCNFPSMCLQHGLSVQKCAMAQQRIVDNTQMYFLASKYEYKNLSNHVYNYQDFDILKMTGIGRYDGLINNDKKQILLSPTWRMYNAMPVTTSEGEQRAYNPEFKHTTYYKIYNDLINNKKLIDTAKRTGYKIKYVLHPILSSQVNDFIPDPYVEVVSSVGDFNYETAFQAI